MKVQIALLVLLAASSSYAFDSSKCSSMMNNGMYKKYKWAGVGEANAKAITNETKSAGTTKATSNMSTEGSTASLDPKYSTNVSLSGTQGTSSFGQCSLFGLYERREQRDLYVQQNFEQIKKDIANGSGEHMNTLAWFALCDDSASAAYSQTLQNGFESLSSASEANFTRQMDSLIDGNSSLKGQCLNLTTI